MFFDRLISLGSDCSVAGMLRKTGYKERSYPFDWNVTYISFVIYSFKTKFKHYEDIYNKFKTFTCPRTQKQIGHYDLKQFYYHEPYYPKAEDFKKYEKRAKKFNELLNSGKKILFIRKAGNVLEDKDEGIKETIEDIKKIKRHNT